ncbi:MAG: hypothetical protein V1725_03950 [archaeon]
MSESGDYDPGPWRGHDFASARRSYDVHVGRSYDDAKAARKDTKAVLEQRVKTDSSAALVIACDVTGSMGDWPATMFSKLPYLEHEAKEYLGDDLEICFSAVGDAYSDSYPLQVRPFTKGTDLKKRMEELIIEGNGGGQTSESYDLAALYFLHNAEMNKAIHPVLIFIGDEGLYDFVDKQQAKNVAKIDLDKRLPTKELFDDLKNKYSVYLIRKPYESSGDRMSSTDMRIYKQWETLLGPDRISTLPEAGRVVDVIFGILAKETNRVDYFHQELIERQKPEQVAVVMKSLESVHRPDPLKADHLLRSGKSVTIRKDVGKPSKELL